ncbi:ROK family protein [Lysinibacter sp. HNR]|uniref:ROK family protein n=1 Tax=Lysinibacter sp. HNR TaxID=3031408 RepID=UPI002434A646|nr:ROK family protein [Lysinibacter sp. HNR]WGD37820.1 ROK family protein [Lysinibacter sp. HNR]
MSPPKNHEREMLALHQRNTAACISVLRDHTRLTLSQLSELTGLSRPTVDMILGELITRGIAHEHPKPEHGPIRTGRPARHFSFVARAAHTASVDLGLHRITVLISDLAGIIVSSLTYKMTADTPAYDLFPLVGDLVRKAIHPLGITEKQLACAVISVTGIVDERGRMIQSNLLPGWNGISLSERFGAHLITPVIIENDINMAAIAEVHTGSANSATDAVFVMVGHRINSALILGGSLHRGRHYAAGEIGDLAIAGWGYTGEGKDNTPESYSIEEMEHVFARAEEGDPAAQRQIRSFASKIVRGIALVGLAVDPDLIVIGGGVSRAGDPLITLLNEEFARIVKRNSAPAIVGSTLGANGVAIGGIIRSLEFVSTEIYGAEDLPVPRLSLPLKDSSASGSLTDNFGLALDRFIHQDAALSSGSISDESQAAWQVEAPHRTATTAASQEATSRAASAPTASREPDLRIAIVGFGMRSGISTWAHQPGQGALVTAVVDPDPAARLRAAEQFGENIELLSNHLDLNRTLIDAAIVVTPDDTHHSITAHLLQAGIAVYLDKPIATTTDDADDLLEIAHRSGSKLYIGHNMRHMAVVRLMRDIIMRGEIGAVKAVWCRHFVGNGGDYYFKDWHADRRRSNGLLLQKGAHDLDVIHWLADSHTTEVVGMGDLSVYGDISDRRERPGELMRDWFSLDNWPPLSQTGLHPVIDVEDQSMVLMRLASGVLASYQQCHFTPDYWRNYTVIGTEGRLENHGDGGGGDSVVRVWNSRTTFSPAGNVTYPVVDDSSGHGDADRTTMREFINFVRFGHKTDTSPVGARDAVATAVAATESLRNGSTPQRIRPVDPHLAEYFALNQITR